MNFQKSENFKKIFCILLNFIIVLSLIPFANCIEACALSENEIVYVNTHNNARNSSTGGIYKSGGRTVKALVLPIILLRAALK